MNIGYFTSAFPYKDPSTGDSTGLYRGGGVENGTYNLATHMAKRGHKIFIFTSSINSEDSVESYDNIEIHRYASKFVIGQCPISPSLLYKPLFSNIDLDIVHGRMGNLPAPFTAYLYAKKMKKKFVISYHGDWINGYGSVIRRIGVFMYNNFLRDIILSRASLIIALSKYHINQSTALKKYYPKINIIPNGVNIEEFDISLSKGECRKKLNLSNNKNIILFVGSLVPVKAPQILLKAMVHVLNECPNSHLIYIGEGSCKEYLINSCKQMGIESNVFFQGYVQGEDKILYYKSADVFVLPSISEAFPNVLLEASAAGLPMVVSGLECFKVLVKNEYNGLFTKTGDDLDLAQKIISILKSENMRENMSLNAKENVMDYTWKNVAEETEKAYLKLL
ncbi:glycosyltransferase family 4 protein [Methanolobus bombayensis]|uniref:glycosyltransferase family 4 protein n=1 Tax=Methanolobus bombayensis TaxID=38023 RepID=UPI001AEB1ACA|nr:glycosyltransferase family 4 protein [Methanolobus bombayensis]MBP1910657.1 glycosyltransferase involved in cell wall biosynthesis [Methanolobus bombayensis]